MSEMQRDQLLRVARVHDPALVRDEIVRHTASTRINHWLVAISFVLLALSGLAMFDPITFWLSSLFGGGATTRAIHPWIGVFMAIAFFLLALKSWGDNRMTAADRQWLRDFRSKIGNQGDEGEDIGRYNGAQKLVFMLSVLCVLGLLLSGLAIWRAYFAAYFPIELTRIASLAHAFFAFVLILTIITHIYAAIWVKGSIRAMTRGTVSAGWAWKHHRAWFRDVINGVKRSDTVS